ncbi:DNA topoisomerase I [Wohlfahrtiimonas chitiniclastica]|uniref:DNA topoisomerase I n=1 Tax=Wohlfahrtiimonas chitiniclastica TaxID=400946 RepID=UPI000B9806D9|nr:DNA topoisomerase I [Wohlfahrtiimonas chitiniclastica]OYQ82047.1 DNA topoisomerase I [Wohlfahrtiimonas chitiniclastica]OYQ83875.1 DNA topoisomerase I [Wohlfahrtiimonas chitiniclastica]OYQ84714.1 DNA topoisomerase I [Wohlfahrtiimonas chitiniclastica]
MSKTLVIVESPAKAKTINKYLGKDYKVLASFGHIRDLVPKTGAVDPDHDFAMKYEIVERNQKHINEIVKALKDADALLLATDPDREGEAISWHIKEYLDEKNLLKDKSVARVVFHEITKSAIEEAITHPRDISMDMVNAQQARRALDYLVGFNLSPLLWKKISPGLSAGRVQTPALRMICEREDAIEAFKPEEYWTIESQLKHNDVAFKGRLTEFDGQKVEQFSFTNEPSAMAAKNALIQTFGQMLPVYNIEKKQRRRNPTAPFTTSTMQQEAARKLGFATTRTMRTAQSLYEGINIGTETIGLITYMRTDSVSLAKEAVEEIAALVKTRYGDDYLPETPRVYKTKSKNAQEAHEAIRPTSAFRHPDDIKQYLTSDQFRLYELIWKRTVASQMSSAILDTVAVDLGQAKLHTFRANGSTILFPGFIIVYTESFDDKKEEDDEKLLPALNVGDAVHIDEVIATQHFTEPPPRFSEASLVKALEEHDIGRPSTYSAIISTLQNREYVTVDQRRFFPTDVGRIVSRFLTEHFTQYVDYDFTAKMEGELDEIANGQLAWIPVMKEFWTPFHELCVTKDESVSRADVAQARELGIDPKSGKPVSVRIGRFGPFAQIGDKDDEEKPKFASLRKEQRINTITLEEALALFTLPRSLGTTEEGEAVRANIGRFGPYIQYGQKFVSLKEDDPYTIELPRALELVAAHKAAEAAKFIKAFEEHNIQILNGRWGPYVTDGEKNARIPKDCENPAALTLEECQELLAKAPAKRTKKKAVKKAAPKKATTKKTPAKKSTKKADDADGKEKPKKAAAKKAPAKKATPKKTAAKKVTKKESE